MTRDAADKHYQRVRLFHACKGLHPQLKTCGPEPPAFVNQIAQRQLYRQAATIGQHLKQSLGHCFISQSGRAKRAIRAPGTAQRQPRGSIFIYPALGLGQVQVETEGVARGGRQIGIPGDQIRRTGS